MMSVYHIRDFGEVVESIYYLDAASSNLFGNRSQLRTKYNRLMANRSQAQRQVARNNFGACAACQGNIRQQNSHCCVLRYLGLLSRKILIHNNSVRNAPGERNSARVAGG